MSDELWWLRDGTFHLAVPQPTGSHYEKAEAVRLGDVLDRIVWDTDANGGYAIVRREAIEKFLGGPDALVVKPRVDDA